MRIPIQLLRFEAEAPTPVAIAKEVTAITTLPVTIQIIDGERKKFFDIAIAFDAVPEETVRISGFCRDNPGQARYAETPSHLYSLDERTSIEPPIRKNENTIGLDPNRREGTLFWAIWKALQQLDAIPTDNSIDGLAPKEIGPITEEELLKRWRKARRLERLMCISYDLI